MPESERQLRPLESVIIRLAGEGHSVPEIGRRVGKRPGTVHRIRKMIDYKDGIPVQLEVDRGSLSALERVIESHRQKGETFGEIGKRTGRSGAQIRRIAQMTEFRP